MSDDKSNRTAEIAKMIENGRVFVSHTSRILEELREYASHYCPAGKRVLRPYFFWHPKLKRVIPKYTFVRKLSKKVKRAIFRLMVVEFKKCLATEEIFLKDMREKYGVRNEK